LVFALHLLQPAVRGWHRYLYRAKSRSQGKAVSDHDAAVEVNRISPGTWDLYWRSREGMGREQLLESFVPIACDNQLPGIFFSEWERWDVALLPDPWHAVRIYTATEELGGSKRFTRARCVLQAGGLFKATKVAAGIVTVAAVIGMRPWAISIAGGAWLALAALRLWSGRRCLRAATSLLARAAQAARLEPVTVSQPASASAAQEDAAVEPAGLLPG
jgi:hypothetical protein